MRPHDKLNASYNALQRLTEDFAHDGIFEMLLRDPKDKTANAELRTAVSHLKRDSPETFTILLAAMKEVVV